MEIYLRELNSNGYHHLDYGGKIMHHRLIVASSQDAKSDHITSQTVTKEVIEWLDENGFASQNGRWSSGPSDWYVVGGRWSGCLEQYEHNADYAECVKFAKTVGTPKEKKDLKWDLFINSQFVQKYQDKFNAWWREKTGTDSTHPWLRDTYINEGYEGDSSLLTENLWNYFSQKDESKFSYQCEESWQMVDRWERPSKNTHKADIDYGYDTVWDDLKGKWTNTNPDDFLDESKPNTNDQIWLTVVDYHY
jgi:hypothetical protein